MPVSRIGRVHLIYQLIILALLVMLIGSNELISERKYFYLFICIFFFAMMILSCYTELLPIQKWTAKYSSPESSESNEKSCRRDSSTAEKSNVAAQEKNGSERPENAESLNKPPRVYRLRNWKKDPSFENNSVKKSTNTFDVSSVVPMENIREYNFGTYGSKDSNLTKRYYFPFREKRLEEWVDAKETRPYKMRPWRSNHQENETTETKSIPDSTEASSPKNSDQLPTSGSPQSPDLGIPKSFSFPFRRKRLENWMEIQENQKESLEITSSLPQWKGIDYSEYDPEFRIRRSFSGSALNSEELDSAAIDKEKDFSQSIEVACVPSAVNSNEPTSPSNAIVKIKAGVKDYFSKIKKESFKGDKAKGDSKRRAFKSFFQSKENVSLNGADKKKSPKLSIPE